MGKAVLSVVGQDIHVLDVTKTNQLCAGLILWNVMPGRREKCF